MKMTAKYDKPIVTEVPGVLNEAVADVAAPYAISTSDGTATLLVREGSATLVGERYTIKDGLDHSTR